MSKTKSLSHREMKVLLDKFNETPQEILEQYAVHNNMSVDELRCGLQETCYHIEHLSFTYRRSLRKEIDQMDAETIEIVERINQMKITEIKESLDQEIAEYNAHQKKQRAFNKAWSIRKAQIYKQLIKEGLVTIETDSVSIEQFLPVRKRVDEEFKKFREEFEASYTES